MLNHELVTNDSHVPQLNPGAIIDYAMLVKSRGLTGTQGTGGTTGTGTTVAQTKVSFTAAQWSFINGQYELTLPTAQLANDIFEISPEFPAGSEVSCEVIGFGGGIKLFSYKPFDGFVVSGA